MLPTRVVFLECVIFIKISTSVVGMLFGNDPVCCVHVPCNMTVGYIKKLDILVTYQKKDISSLHIVERVECVIFLVCQSPFIS